MPKNSRPSSSANQRTSRPHAEVSAQRGSEVNSNGSDPSSILSSAADVVLCAVAMTGSMGRLWEQDVWWQLRLGDEMLFKGNWFPQHEEWTYTSSHEAFHNHWWLFALPFSLLYHLGGGVAGLVALRGAMCAIYVKLLLMLRSGPLRWVIAAVSYRVSKHRLQCRPEVACLLLFAVLPILRRRLQQRDEELGAHSKKKQSSPSLVSTLWPREVLWMYLTVVAAANAHFGVVPWPVLFCGSLLADELFASGAPNAKVWRWLPWLNLTAFARAAPVVFLIFINPQPLAGLGYILHHRPGKYQTEKKLSNPEHRGFVDEATEYWDTPDKLKLFFSSFGLSHVPWIGVFFIAAIVIPLLWLCQPWHQRPPGLRSPLISLLAHAIMTYLVYDRTRTVVWPITFLAAMAARLGSQPDEELRSSPSNNKQKRLRKQGFLAESASGVWAVLCFVAGLAIVGIDIQSPSFKLSAHTWPVRSTEFVRSRNLKGNVYHTITFGGYLSYWLQDNLHFADTREYCFRHLDALYAAVYLDPVRLNRDILEAYNVDIFIALIPQTRPLPMGGFEDVSARFLPGNVWARVYFDHVSEVFLRRIPRFKSLIAEKEIKAMNPAFPPDYHVRVLMGRDPGNPKGLEKDLEVCLARKELYCQLIAALRSSATGPHEAIVNWLKELETMDPGDIKDERTLTRGYYESAKLHLRNVLGVR